MASRRIDNQPKDSKPRRPPATTPEAREQQLIALASDLAEKQIRDGSASSQLITHFLKLGSTRERLEQDRLRSENKMLIAKVDQLESQTRTEEMYREALAAMRSYSGTPVGETEDDYAD